ncbi:MAG TPA: tetratricopeptide repeat protein [bacterium]|nr:tetratricopeptide repeat protein [bacterium]
MTKRRRGCALMVIATVAIIALSVNPATACETCTRAREALFADPPKLAQGLGMIHMPVTTDNKEAQCYFDQGVAYLYAFNHDEAARNFRQAAALDPNLAMAHWGVAYALGPNYNLPADSTHLALCWEAIQKALALKQHASPREQAYIDAMAKRYAADVAAPRPPLDSAYYRAMRDLMQAYPDDLHAAVMFVESGMNLRPWKLWRNDGTPEPGTLELVATLERVLQRDPGHTGANHYYIHCVEASTDPERALSACMRLDTLASNAGHLIHMPAHIYSRTGDYARSAKSNADGAAIDEKYLATAPKGNMYGLMYYHHNVHFLSVAQQMEGKYEASLANALKLERSVSEFIKDVPLLEGVYMTSLLCYVRFNRWSEILALPKPDPSLKTITALWHYARATALVESARLKDAQKEFKAYRAAAAAVPPENLIGFWNSAQYVFTITDDVLTARLLDAGGKTDSAVVLLQRAVIAEDNLAYDEPEGWYIPVRETLGAYLLKLGRAAEAEQVFRDELQKHKRSGRALFGLREALKAQGDTENAQLVDLQFQAAWRNADTQLRLEDL